MATSEWGECKDCKWFQIEPDANAADNTLGLCIADVAGKGIPAAANSSWPWMMSCWRDLVRRGRLISASWAGVAAMWTGQRIYPSSFAPKSVSSVAIAANAWI